jgi:hypothetical protein
MSTTKRLRRERIAVCTLPPEARGETGVQLPLFELSAQEEALRAEGLRPRLSPLPS